MTDITRLGPGPLASRREWIGLAVLALPTLLLSLDLSVLNLALPHFSSGLDANSTQQLWIVDMYGFMLAGFLVTMGTLGDRIGRRRLLLLGAAAFGGASVLAAYSTSAEMLIFSRALMGVTGATLMPSTLALISNMFLDAKQRSVAISVWFSCILGGLALGPAVGGLLLERFWWGSVFLIAVPVMLLLLATGPRLLPEYRNSEPGRLDLPSVALSLGAILPFIFGLKELARNGSGAVPLLAIVVGVAVGVVFVLRQRMLTHPLLDMSLFTSRPFTAALTILLLAGVTQAGLYLLVSLYLQTVAGLSPLQAGLSLVPSALAMITSLMLAPIIARRLRPGIIMATGLVVAAVGYLMFTWIDTTALPVAIVGIALVGLGSGPMAALSTNLVVGSAPPEKAGSAASISETSGQFGIALGIASFGSLATAVYRTQTADTLPLAIQPEVADTARESIIGGVAVAQQLPEALGATLLDAAREAFTSGIHLAGWVMATVTVGLVVVTIAAFRHLPPIGETVASPDEAAVPASD